MPTHVERYRSQYGCEEIRRIVLDFASYEEFVPWCSRSMVSSQGPPTATVRFEVRSAVLAGWVTMDVDYREPQKIVFQYLRGPWKGVENLKCSWKFAPAD